MCEYVFKQGFIIVCQLFDLDKCLYGTIAFFLQQ